MTYLDHKTRVNAALALALVLAALALHWHAIFVFLSSILKRWSASNLLNFDLSFVEGLFSHAISTNLATSFSLLSLYYVVWAAITGLVLWTSARLGPRTALVTAVVTTGLTLGVPAPLLFAAYAGPEGMDTLDIMVTGSTGGWSLLHPLSVSATDVLVQFAPYRDEFADEAVIGVKHLASYSFFVTGLTTLIAAGALLLLATARPPERTVVRCRRVADCGR